MPHISPITSLQNDETLSFFWISFTAVLAPFTFLDAIELNGDMSTDVTAIPIISKDIPIPTNNSIIIASITSGTFGSNDSDNSEKIKDIVKANKVIDDMKKDGRYQKLLDKYFSSDKNKDENNGDKK